MLELKLLILNNIRAYFFEIIVFFKLLTFHVLMYKLLGLLIMHICTL